MKPIKIMTDTASDITLELAKENDIELLPINISFGETQYKDRYDLTSDEFYKKMESVDELPKTAQITVSEHYDEFKKFSDDYTIIYCPISSKGSGTAQSANMAKQMIEDENPDADIRIADCNTFTYGYGLWVLRAAKMAKDGASADDIVNMLNKNIADTEIIFAVEDLKYLRKGGRISPAANILANVLDIKPILTIDDGLVTGKDKVRGSKKLYKKLLDILVADAREDYDQTVVILHGQAPDKAEILKNLLLENTPFKNTVTVEVGPTIGVHTGPSVIAYAFLKK